MGQPPYCYVLVAVLTIVGVISTVHAELTPPYFNLAEGRKITATATCGVDTDGPELFCKLVGANTENEYNDYYSLLRGQVSRFSLSFQSNCPASGKKLSPTRPQNASRVQTTTAEKAIRRTHSAGWKVRSH